MVNSTKNNISIFTLQIWLAMYYLDLDKIEPFQMTHPNVTSSPKKSHVGRAFSNDANQR